MVYYSSIAQNDLYSIVTGLVFWGKHPLELEHALAYVEDIRTECDKLDKKIYHFKPAHSEHWQHGKYVFSYKRNPRTTWYVIYDVDNNNNVYINKIISNYLTKA